LLTQTWTLYETNLRHRVTTPSLARRWRHRERQTKSGTNDFHGAFLFRRTDATRQRIRSRSGTRSRSNPYKVAYPLRQVQQFGGLSVVLSSRISVLFGDYQALGKQWVTNQLTIHSRVVSTCNPATNATALLWFLRLEPVFTAGINGGGQAYDPSTGRTWQRWCRNPYGPQVLHRTAFRWPDFTQAAAMLALFLPDNIWSTQQLLRPGPGPSAKTASTPG